MTPTPRDAAIAALKKYAPVVAPENMSDQHMMLYLAARHVIVEQAHTALKQEARGEASEAVDGFYSRWINFLAHNETLGAEFKRHLMEIATAPDEWTLPELPEGWEILQLAKTLDRSKWLCQIYRPDEIGKGVIETGPTPRAACLAAVAKITPPANAAKGKL